jgi:hypothetical protein
VTHEKGRESQALLIIDAAAPPVNRPKMVDFRRNMRAIFAVAAIY